MTNQVKVIMETAEPLINNYVKQLVEKSQAKEHTNLLPATEPILSEELIDCLLHRGENNSGERVVMVRELLALLKPIVEGAEKQEQSHIRTR